MRLTIRDLSKTYSNGVRALRRVDLTIPPGMFGLLGPNGAGKSTLMRTLATLQEPDTGAVQFGAIDVLRDKYAVRELLGYLPQEFGLYPTMTAAQTLDHFAVLKGIVDRRQRKDHIDALIERTNLGHARKQAVGGFSGGMKQRLGIAVALLGGPRLLIVDEPTAGLDPTERHRLLDLLSELGQDIVVILSTHIVQDVAELCPQFAILAGGEVLHTGAPEAAVAALRGKIWRRVVARADLPTLQRSSHVISTRLIAGHPVVHVHHEGPPGPEFEPVAPDLEDVYFHQLSRASRGAA